MNLTTNADRVMMFCILASMAIFDAFSTLLSILKKGIFIDQRSILMQKTNRELKSKHKMIKKIGKNIALYCSPGHFVGFKPYVKEEIKLKKYLFKHQIKKKFQYSLEWQKDQLAIWDNRSMLHQATRFKGNRIMHRITIQ